MNSFNAELKSKIGEPNLDQIVEDLAYKESKKKFKDLDINSRKEFSSELFIMFYSSLNELGLLTNENIKVILSSIKKALIQDEENYLYELLYKSERIKKDLEKQVIQIRKIVFQSYKGIEDNIKNSEIKDKDKILSIINSQTVDTVLLENIISEISESVFVTILESNEDVEETTREFSKSLTYKSIFEGSFKKSRILEIARIIISQAISVSNLSQAYTKEIISGAVYGVNEGIIRAMEKVKNDFKFAPEEVSINYKNTQKDFENMDKEYIELLQMLSSLSDEPAKSDLEDIIKKDYTGYFAILKKASSDLSQQIKETLEDMNVQENYKELSKFTSEKFEDLKKDFSEKKEKFVDEFELDKKFDKFKNEIEKIEKKILAKFSEFKEKDSKVSSEELAKRTYEATKHKMKEEKDLDENS
ncbi:hypothetical protein CBLAS_1711 [Campylobacter blaseri]|uniref:Uncharacterized protein n=1 Tax=Campylobacter blaseri TaxID=2042961 RepID=A0A2P8R3Z0_9BACT|nr:hypothetical protein [Campylobacter blaseri]PSM53195.1 hypothetical protein CQ405_01210 [Campylobacter blaseri]PSM54661.1 hypothetical protein CRN67_01210 [Campylobacter blaseri]QKF86862.1 hypothetical protein CBLAS_1711 [Campylobacter blaseri]